MKITIVPLMFVAAFTIQADSVTATSSRSMYNVNDPVSVNVSVSNVTDLFAFEFDLIFDPSVLSAQSVTEGGYFLSNGVSFSPGTIDNTAGTISFIGDSLSGPGPGASDTLLVTALFTAIAPGSTQVSPENIILLDSNLSSIAASTSASMVNVSGVPTPEPDSLGLVGGMISVGLLAIRKRRCSASGADQTGSIAREFCPHDNGFARKDRREYLDLQSKRLLMRLANM